MITPYFTLLRYFQWFPPTLAALTYCWIWDEHWEYQTLEYETPGYISGRMRYSSCRFWGLGCRWKAALSVAVKIATCCRCSVNGWWMPGRHPLIRASNAPQLRSHTPHKPLKMLVSRHYTWTHAPGFEWCRALKIILTYPKSFAHYMNVHVCIQAHTSTHTLMHARALRILFENSVSTLKVNCRVM